MEDAGIILAASLQDALDSRQTVGTDAAVGPVVDAADISQAGVPLLIQQIGHHLLLAPVEVHLHLVELIVVLIGVHEDDGKRQGAEKVDLLLAEHPQGDDAIHLLGLAEGQPDKRDLVLVGHHLHQAGQGREPHIGPVRTDDPPVRHSDHQMGLALRRPPLSGRHIAQGVGRLKNPGPYLRRDRDVVVLIQNPGDGRSGDLGRLGHILNRCHAVPPSVLF